MASRPPTPMALAAVALDLFLPEAAPSDPELADACSAALLALAPLAEGADGPCGSESTELAHSQRSMASSALSHLLDRVGILAPLPSAVLVLERLASEGEMQSARSLWTSRSLRTRACAERSADLWIRAFDCAAADGSLRELGELSDSALWLLDDPRIASRFIRRIVDAAESESTDAFGNAAPPIPASGARPLDRLPAPARIELLAELRGRFSEAPQKLLSVEASLRSICFSVAKAFDEQAFPAPTPKRRPLRPISSEEGLRAAEGRIFWENALKDDFAAAAASGSPEGAGAAFGLLGKARFDAAHSLFKALAPLAPAEGWPLPLLLDSNHRSAFLPGGASRREPGQRWMALPFGALDRDRAGPFEAALLGGAERLSKTQWNIRQSSVADNDAFLRACASDVAAPFAGSVHWLSDPAAAARIFGLDPYPASALAAELSERRAWVESLARPDPAPLRSSRPLKA